LEVVGLTVEQYDWLVESGKLPEDPTTELIDGFIVKKDRSAVGENPMTVGDRHRFAVMILTRLDSEFSRIGCCVQSQQPISLPPRNQPEPDLAVLAGRAEDYKKRKAGISDIFSVVEVAESSLGRDLGTKLRVYAKAKIPEYIVVNLIDKLVLVHHRPVRSTYADVTPLRPGDTLKISAKDGKTVSIEVASLL